MIGHLDVEAIAPGVPSSLAPETYAYLREELGFEGVAITDSLGMGAVAGTPALAVKALQAGADLLLMPADTRRAHQTITRALDDGSLDRARVEGIIPVADPEEAGGLLERLRTEAWDVKEVVAGCERAVLVAVVDDGVR
mgnify:CR=1 FL=1